MNQGLLTALKDFDRQRPAVPGEHFIKLGLGALMLRGGLVSKLIGGALIYRAFTGKDGLAQKLQGGNAARSMPDDAQRRGEGFVDVASPWPYEERVQVAEPSSASPGTRASGIST